MLLTGCSAVENELDRAMGLRTKLLSSTYAFDAVVTADYVAGTNTFAMHCQGDALGNVTFEVTEPESLAGITGRLTGERGALMFDDAALAFDLLADGELSPVSAPWVVVRSLRSGYLADCGKEGQHLRLSVHDTYADDALHLDVWLDGEDVPVQADVLWKNRRILAVAIENFSFQ